MAEFKPSWSDSLKFDGGSFGGGGSGNFSSAFSSSGPTFNPGVAFSGGDPFGLNKEEKQKKEAPWGDVLRFAGDKLSEYAKNQSGQSGKADGLTVGGGGGVAQSGDLTIVYPQAPTVMAGQKGGLGSALGSIAGAALGSFIPGIGTSLGAGIGGSIGGAFG